ncbi:MAG: radical family heme chaperone HemW [Bacteroidota bacterium]|jgi:oxygen-independent coproporphyrinogen III oxidase
MAGIYIHVPFCQKACNYCDFHFTTNHTLVQQMVDAMVQELYLQKEYFAKDQIIQTLYLGGGTPSLLSSDQLEVLMQAVKANFNLANEVEVTLEVNPDNVTNDNVDLWKFHGVNRISLGIQTLNQDSLKWMNRSHTSDQALKAIELLISSNQFNLSCDLIFATPFTTLKNLEYDLTQVTKLGINHLSCYNLTVEPQTKLYKQVAKQPTLITSDEEAIKQFEFIQQFTTSKGFEHYEISNYALPNCYSKHNTAYWQSRPYLGIGPSAHSYIDGVRSFNIKSNAAYIKAIKERTVPNIIEPLTLENKFNEYVLTRLRTKWGINMEELRNIFGPQAEAHFHRELKKIFHHQWIHQVDQNFVLTKEGKCHADTAAAALFLEQ